MFSEEIKKALVHIAITITKSIINDMVYDYHFVGYVTSVNANGTYDVYSNEKEGEIFGVRCCTNIKPNVGNRVFVRETKNVPDSYMIDYID